MDTKFDPGAIKSTQMDEPVGEEQTHQGAGMLSGRQNEVDCTPAGPSQQVSEVPYINVALPVLPVGTHITHGTLRRAVALGGS